ncbi:HET-domain-containing protein, partial [Lojkania enalia]
WVALSHCWGRTEEDAPWKLTKARVQQYTAEIPWNLMPRTFQEAIEISRALGERYLWIDSLCIIQDSKEDWSIQSSAMCDIYSNSVVTISTATSSVHEGCIVARSPEDVVPVKFDLSSSRGSIYLYPPLPPDRNAVEAAPVSTRAWCLQESEISMRTIQFTTHQWIWTCNQIKCNEVDLIERDSHILSIHSAVDFTSILNVRREPEPPGLSFGPVSLNFESSTLWIPRHNYIEWYRKMEEYSRRNITYPKDRLPALIGLAERRGEFIPSSYAAGLWEADILYGLQWHPVNKVEKRILPEMAPSWSCVTLNAPISF